MPLFLPSAEPKVYESLFFLASHFVEIDICRTLIPLVLGFHGCLDFMDFWTSWIFGLGFLDYDFWTRIFGLVFLDLMDFLIFFSLAAAAAGFWISRIFGFDGLLNLKDFWIS